MCNTIVTNIPGPQVPLYLLGHKMLSWYPYVPIGGEMGVNCAILSYNGVAYFGFTCDVNAVPDPENLEKFLAVSCAELRDASANLQVQPPVPEPSTRTGTSRTIPLVTKPKASKSRVKAKATPKVPAAAGPVKGPAKRSARKAPIKVSKAVTSQPPREPVQVTEAIPGPRPTEVLELVGA